MADDLPRMYTDLAEWFHLLSPPDEYAEEADFYLRTLNLASDGTLRTLLELGSGAGNNASHYKRQVEATLVEPSAGMLRLSQRLNPECEHIEGDMRTVRLDRLFDAVFVHDAVCYMTTEDDVRQAMTTAFIHCRAGGVALFAPDHVRENFPQGQEQSTEHGGSDGDDGRGMRFVRWTWDPDPSDSTYQVDYAYLFRETGQPTRAAYDRHVCGLFSRADWLRLLGEVGFRARVVPFEHSELPSGSLEVFVGRKSA